MEKIFSIKWDDPIYGQYILNCEAYQCSICGEYCFPFETLLKMEEKENSIYENWLNTQSEDCFLTLEETCNELCISIEDFSNNKRINRRVIFSKVINGNKMFHTTVAVTFAEDVNAKTISMEDLTGIRKNKKQGKKQKAANHRWPYAQCQFYIRYKAEAKGVEVENVSPAYTSQSCPCCGHTEKINRKGLLFKCKSCDYQDNADRVGSINIGLRLISQRQASEERAVYQPAYSSDKSVSSC